MDHTLKQEHVSSPTHTDLQPLPVSGIPGLYLLYRPASAAHSSPSCTGNEMVKRTECLPSQTTGSSHASKSRAEQDCRGMAWQMGGCLEEGSSCQGRDDNNRGQEPDRRAPTRGGKKP